MPAHRERDCPKCGNGTEIRDDIQNGGKLRVCESDDCNWCVEISGGY